MTRPRIDSLGWLNPKTVVHSFAKFLLASQVALCRLHGYMSQQELDLFQFTARSVTEACA
jgi:hypothetical protein